MSSLTPHDADYDDDDDDDESITGLQCKDYSTLSPAFEIVKPAQENFENSATDINRMK